jgi:hypothetical protein
VKVDIDRIVADVSDRKQIGWAQVIAYGHSIEVRRLTGGVVAYNIQVVPLLRHGPRSKQVVSMDGVHDERISTGASTERAYMLAGMIAHAIGIPPEMIERATSTPNGPQREVTVTWRLAL